MKMITPFIIPGLAALIFALILIPIMKKIAISIGLVDKPNARKVHTDSVPLIGGLSIGVTTALAMILSPLFTDNFNNNIVWICGAIVMLIIGSLDDRFNLKASLRLFIQMACAYAVAYSGIRINSFYGLFGVNEIPVFVQYGLTIIVIAGVVNAYNLMDGIDGLLGGLTLVGTSVLAVISFQLKQYELTVLYIAIIGSILGFLRYNLSLKKIFMGDAGSLFIGFILIVTSIKLLNASGGANSIEQLKVLLLVGGIFLVPVLDSLRVYRGRVKKGISPFKADKTHLHHLFLVLGITHKRATLLIVILAVLITAIVAGLIYLIPVTWVILIGVSVFVVVTIILTLNHSVAEWKEKLKKLERNS
jgi:UDP-GlcNAc:undecaprenyl-phosphate/decaprenyl-phosphate GlcNAc-1-phosphate transferase